MKKLLVFIICFLSLGCMLRAEKNNRFMLDGGFNFNKGYLIGFSYDYSIPTLKRQGIGMAFDYVQTKRKYVGESDFNPYVALFSPQYRYSLIDRYFFLELIGGIPLGFSGYSDTKNRGNDVKFTYGFHAKVYAGYHIDKNWCVAIWIKDLVLSRSHIHINTFLGGASIGYKF